MSVYYSPPPGYSTSSPDERTALMDNKRRGRSKWTTIFIITTFILLALNIVQCTVWYNSDDNPEHRDRVRQRWNKEVALRKERFAREDAQRKREQAAEEHQRKERFAREDAEREREWKVKDALRREQMRLEDIEREKIFQGRKTALDTRQKKIDDKEREIKEEKDRRERAGLVWAHLTMHERCLEYGTRQYHAELLNIPQWEDAHRWCMETPIKINGFEHDHPDYCTVEGSSEGNGQVIAYWTVRSHEPTCMTGWFKLQDKGCGLYGSRQRMFEAMLWNHQAPWDNWREMCSTTPIRFDDHVFDQPISCDHRGREGIWGTWAVHDDTC